MAKKYDFNGKPYCTWADETSGIGGKARPTTYGIYSNLTDDKYHIDGFEPKNYEQAAKMATKLNDIYEEGRNVGMTQGIAVAVNYSLRGESEEGIWSSGGMTIRECIEHKVDDFDLDKLIPRFATPEDAQTIAEYYSEKEGDSDDDEERRTTACEFLEQLDEEVDEETDRLQREAYIRIVKGEQD